jgi:UDP-N-acetylmuramoyl-L-alanyl-D-glutamate--2,6-diaminopimelate ligase
MLGKGASHLLMEATSHGIARKRLDGVRFEVAALTNLTHDHLDLHGSMEAYGQAKARLFTELSPANAAVVVDGDFGAQLARQVPTEVLRVSCQPQGRADIRPAAPAVLDAHGIRCSVLTPTGTVTLSSPLVGRHNLENLLLAQAVLIALGVDGRQAARQLGQCTAVSGRLERCDGPGDDLIALVDYAHTPDGLDKALAAARLLTDGRVLCVFGCGGNRDPAKRPLMGHVAGRLADETIVTNDNPRTEPPESIAAAIIDELHRAGADFAVELDRAAAIELAVSHADPGDAVVVAGKGHETTQIVGTESVPFDDSSILRRALKRRRNLPPGA